MFQLLEIQRWKLVWGRNLLLWMLISMLLLHLMMLLVLNHSLIMLDLLTIFFILDYRRWLLALIMNLNTGSLTQKWLLLERLLLIHKPKLLHVSPLRWELFGVVLKESIIFHYPLSDLLDCLRRLSLIDLELLDPSSIKRGYQFLTVSGDLSREIGPLNLWFKECLFCELLFLLESN